MRTYVNDAASAESTVARIVEQVRQGHVRWLIGFDVETAPLPGLVGYPGTVLDDERELIKPTKKSYLEYAQCLWRSHFDPSKLQLLGVYLPKKTTAGNESPGVAAKHAWELFLARINELERTPEGRTALEQARWTEETRAKRAAECWNDVYTLLNQEIELEIELKKATKGHRKLESELKRLQKRRVETHEEAVFLRDTVTTALEQPLDLRLLTHVVRVGVENRVRVDPVRPGLDPYTSTIFLVQFTLVDVASGELQSYIFNTHKVALELLRPIFRLRGVTFVGANIKFDLKMLMHHLGEAPREVFCTRVANRALYLGIRMSAALDATVKRFLGIEMSKETRNTFVGQRYEEPTPEQLEYAYVDTEVLPALYDAMVAKAEQTGQVELIHNFSRLSWITARWEYQGYRLDTERWLEIAAEAGRNRDTVAAELEQMLLDGCGYLLNEPLVVVPEDTGEGEYDDSEDAPAQDVRSHAVLRISQTRAVAKLLTQLLGMEVTSLEKTARGMLERAYRDQHGKTHPFFALYERWSKLAKQASTYGRRFLWHIHPLSGRFHPSLTIMGTDTGRYTSSPNILNIPAAKEVGDVDYRAAFLAPEGHYLLGGDYAAMEMRIAGDVAQDPMIQKMVLSGADAHTFSAAQMWHVRRAAVDAPRKVPDIYRRGTVEIPIEVYEVPQHWSDEQLAEFSLTEEVAAAVTSVPKKVTRGDAKSVTFLYLFRGTPYTLSVRTGLDEDVCADFFSRFQKVYARLDAKMNELADLVHTNTVRLEDGKQYAFSEGYGGIRRYVELPRNPFIGEFNSSWEYSAAGREYRRRLRACSRELCNLPMQGGNAVVTCEALLNLVESGHRIGVYPFLSIYDEIIAVAPKRIEPKVTKALLEDAMLTAAERYMHFVPPEAEAELSKVGDHWQKS